MKNKVSLKPKSILSIFLWKKLLAKEERGKVRVGYTNDYITKYTLVFGLYEELELEFMKSFSSPETILYDIGANIGNHSVFLSDYYKKVVSFEPDPFTFQILKLNTQHLENVECLNFGLGDQNILANMTRNSGNSGANSITNNSANEGDVAVKVFDELGFEEGPSVFKIDVEGYELHVIKGMIGALSGADNTIFLELNNKSDSKKTIETFNMLKKIGYSAYEITALSFLSRSRLGRIALSLLQLKQEYKLIEILTLKEKDYTSVVFIK